MPEKLRKQLKVISDQIKEINKQLDFLKRDINNVRRERHHLLKAEKERVSHFFSEEISKISGFVNESLREISEETHGQIQKLRIEKQKATGEVKKKASEKIKNLKKQAKKDLVTVAKKQVNKEAERIKGEIVELEKRAITDELTQAFNRSYFEPRLKVEVGIARRSSESVSVVVFDIDDFKNINDSYGHPAGDRVLSSLSRVFSENLRKEDALVRYGGEEFVVILPGVDREEAIKTADRLRMKVEENLVFWEGKELKITVSGGIASFPEDSKNYMNLFRIADKNLLDAKKSGKNRISANLKGDES